MLIERWIQPDARVLDLGCGNGLLLHHLMTHKNSHCYGLEINPNKITACLARGVSVIEQDLNAGLGNFRQNQFDTVIMSQTIQAVQYPASLLEEMLHIGRTGIVSFPNFGHWRIRLHLALGGRMPISESLPYEWHNTPNIHLCTLGDFENLCRQLRFRILDKHVVDIHYTSRPWHNLLPNVFGEFALYHITRN
ncbi:MAG: methionine biosynthesis protein MetW [Gammaproteobacteria bacterium]